LCCAAFSSPGPHAENSSKNTTHGITKPLRAYILLHHRGPYRDKPRTQMETAQCPPSWPHLRVRVRVRVRRLIAQAFKPARHVSHSAVLSLVQGKPGAGWRYHAHFDETTFNRVLLRWSRVTGGHLVNGEDQTQFSQAFT